MIKIIIRPIVNDENYNSIHIVGTEKIVKILGITILTKRLEMPAMYGLDEPCEYTWQI